VAIGHEGHRIGFGGSAETEAVEGADPEGCLKIEWPGRD